MRFTSIAAFASFVAAVLAAENPFSQPDGSSTLVAGEPFIIKWQPTTEGKVILTLRQGESTNLDTVGVIATLTSNTGVYEWTPEESLPAGDDYALMITTSEDDKEPNYTFQFAIDSDEEPKKVSSSASSASASASASASPSDSDDEDSTVTKTTTPTVTDTPYSNGTISSGYTNATMSKSIASKTPSRTASLETESPTESSDESSAIAVVRSPIALVACLVGALFYLN